MAYHTEHFECLQSLSEICFRLSRNDHSREDSTHLKDLFNTLSNGDYRVFTTWFQIQDRPLPLECLWQLQSSNLLQFTTYINCNANMIPDLTESFIEHIWCQNEAIIEDYSESVAGLLGILINFGINTPRDIFRLGQELLTLIVEKFVSRLLQDPENTEEPIPFLPLLLNNAVTIHCRLQKFCISLLRVMVQFMPNTISLEEAVGNQASHYTYVKTPRVITEVFKEIFMKLSPKEVITELNRLVTSEEPFNWQWLLTAVSTFIAFTTEGTELLTEVIELWFSQSCNSKNADLLSVALLCARQCCAENTQRFGSYSTWFSGLQIRHASSFTFFYNFLSYLVPYEPALCLKIHVNKVLSAPVNCHGIIKDYTTLAKTRLSDLNQTTDYVGLFGEYITTEQEGREADVAKVIANFKQTKEISRIVLEASVFRRQFYENVLLAELLKDNNPEHIEFIERLYSLGKIPHALYNRWHQLYF